MFKNLLINEWIKISKRKSNRVFAIIMAAFILLIGLLSVLFRHNTFFKEMPYTSLTVGIVLSVVQFYAIVIGAAVMSNEFKDSTMKHLLVKPVSRASVLLSKLCMVILVIIGLSVILSLLSYLVGMITPGGNDLTFVEVSKMVGYGLPSVIFFVTVAIFISVLLKAPSLAIVIPIVGSFIGTTITFMLAKYDFYKYIIFAHLDPSMYDSDKNIGGGQAPDGFTPGLTIVLYVVYCAAFIALSVWVFRKKEIN